LDYSIPASRDYGTMIEICFYGKLIGLCVDWLIGKPENRRKWKVKSDKVLWKHSCSTWAFRKKSIHQRWIAFFRACKRGLKVRRHFRALRKPINPEKLEIFDFFFFVDPRKMTKIKDFLSFGTHQPINLITLCSPIHLHFGCFLYGLLTFQTFDSLNSLVQQKKLTS